jgi:hypothetical protein
MPDANYCADLVKSAVDVLVGPGPMQDRLHAAWVQLEPLDSCEFPRALRAEFESIMSRLTPSRNGPLPEDDAIELAQGLVNLLVTLTYYERENLQ